jgi:Tol biopolymer transport system component
MIAGAATADPARQGSALAPVRLTFRVGSSICIARADGTHRSGFVRMRPRWAVSRASWSPRGKYAALMRGASLDVVDQRGRVLRHVIRHFSYGHDDPVWSPDGRWIAVESGGHGPGIGIVPASGGDWPAWRELWGPGDLESGADSPTWTPDSRQLAFAAHLLRPLRVENDIYSIGIDGNGLRLLVPDAGHPAYSPDGSRLAYVSGSGGIWVSNADGTNPRRVTTEGLDAHPAWSPRGRLIAFERSVDGHTSIYAVKPDGSGERVLVSSPRYDATLPSWRAATPFHGGPRRPCP